MDTTQAEALPQIKIPANNPTQEEMQTIIANINANYQSEVDTKAVPFNFKKSKDSETGQETLRESVELAIPYPSIDGIVKILGEGGKELEMLLESMATVINNHARTILYTNTELNAATFPVEQLSWNTIANIPKAVRRGGGIPKETWEGFVVDYIQVMPEAAGKNIGQVTKAAGLFKAKLDPVKTNKAVLSLLNEQLSIYASNTPNGEIYVECISFLLNKLELFLNVTDEDLTKNL